MDAYQTLGISRNATKEEIKKAYHRLAHIHHPDKGGDPKKFIEIKKAYEAIVDLSYKERPYTHGDVYVHDEEDYEAMWRRKTILEQQAERDRLYREAMQKLREIYKQQYSGGLNRKIKTVVYNQRTGKLDIVYE